MHQLHGDVEHGVDEQVSHDQDQEMVGSIEWTAGPADINDNEKYMTKIVQNQKSYEHQSDSH